MISRMIKQISSVAAMLLLASAPGHAFEGDASQAYSTLLAEINQSRRRLPMSQELSLTVLTYNIQGLPSDNEAWHDRYAKIGAILRERREKGTAPQIVAIQEAFHPRTDELIAESGYPYYRYGARGNSHNPLPSGLIILSEYPIEIAASIDYRSCVGFDCWANKGALHVRVLAPGLTVPLDVFNTHMNAGPDEPGPERDRARDVRQEQQGELLAFIRNVSLPGAAKIFLGDYNFRPGDSDYESFAAGLGGANAAETCATQPRCSGEPDPGKAWRESVDHIFFKAPVGMSLQPVALEQNFKEIIDGKPLSDHWGLQARVLLRLNAPLQAGR